MSRIRELTNGKASTDNSSSSLLGISGVFTGTGEDVVQFVEVKIAVYSDVASATNGLSIEFSADNVNWYQKDVYTVPAGIAKSYTIQRVDKYFRIVYTNGALAQTAFSLSTIFNRTGGVSSSHRTSEDITGEDDAVLNVSILKTVGSDPSTFNTVDVQHPLPADGDSVYLKDIDVSNSDNGGFSGVVTDYFNSLKTVNNDASATNPKEIKIWLNRSIQTHEIGFGCDDITKNFSNIKVEFLGSAEEVRYTWDGSADGTKRNSYTIQFPPIGFNGVKIYFVTADEIGLSNIIIWKATSVNAKLSATKPDGTVTDIDATAGGNLKISLEEIESGISEDTNTSLRVAPILEDEFGVTHRMAGDNMFAGSPVVIDGPHHETHCGDRYLTSYIEDVSAPSGTAELLVIVPNEVGAKRYHTEFVVTTESEARLEVFEGPTVTANGTAISNYNRERDSVNTSSLAVYHTPTTTADGTRIDAVHWGSGRSSGGSGRTDEWVLGNNTAYLVRVTNYSATANHTTIKVDHYIHPGI